MIAVFMLFESKRVCSCDVTRRNVRTQRDDGRNEYSYLLNLQLPEGMDTREDGLVQTRNSIKWATPDVEKHGEKNDLKYVVCIHK